MPRWCLLPTFAIAFLAQEALTTAATLPFETGSRLQRRGINVLDDKYFIPAIASIGALVLLCLVCLYFLGCCCKRKIDDNSRYSVPSNGALRNSASYPRPTVNLDASDKYSNVSQPRTTPQATPPAPPAAGLQQSDAPPMSWPNNNNNNGNPWAPPLPTSHGFQSSPAHTAVPPSVMSVQHLNSTVATYQHRESQQLQPHRPFIPPHDPHRVSSLSSATSSTQIGGGGTDQAPYVYSPHQGNTLSYASSTSPSMVAPVWDGSTMPMVPTNENPPMVGSSGLDNKQGYSSQYVPMGSGPPAYIDVKGRQPGDVGKS